MAVLVACLQGGPVLATAASGPPSPAWVGLGLVLLVLAIAAIGLLLTRARGGRSGPTPFSRSPFSSRARRRSGAAGSGGGGSVLPGPASVLFPPNHHEKLHDSKYLGRILQAEEESLWESQRQADQEDAPPPGGQRHSHPADDDRSAP